MFSVRKSITDTYLYIKIGVGMKVLLLFSILVIFGVAACGSGPSRYAPEIRESYLSACEGSASRADCECSLEFIEERLSQDEFVAEDLKMAAGQMPSNEFTALLAESVMTCLLKALTGDDGSSSSSSSSPSEKKLERQLTRDEVQDHFSNWLCPGNPEFASSLVTMVFASPFGAAAWDVDIKHEGKASVFEMSESTKKWAASNEYSEENEASIRGLGRCK